MPALNKQTLINLLIDSPLREPIKINLIDIINNTQDADLPKVYPTVIKELEIFQKATERRMKLAEETIAKLNEGGAPAQATDSLPPLPPLPTLPTEPSPATSPTSITPPEPAPLSVPPLDLPPLPGTDTPGSSLPPLPPLPPLPSMPSMPAPSAPATAPEPAAQAPTAAPAPETKAADADEAALAEIQKELDALKSGAAADAQ